MAEVVTHLPPRGHYLAHEVGQLAGVSGYTVGQWARYGYIRSSQSEGNPRVYSYQDVAEAIVVHDLIEREVEPQAIKRAIEQLRSTVGSDWPLQNVALLVPSGHPQRRGVSPLVAVDDEDVVKPHPLLTTDDLVEVRGNLQRGGWAARRAPELDHIVVDPDLLSGAPAIRGTRIPAETAGELAMTEEGVATLEEDYGLSQAQIRDAHTWWLQVKSYDRAA